MRLPAPRSLWLLALPLALSCGPGGEGRGFAWSPAPAPVRVGEQATLAVEPLEDLAAEPEWEIQELHGGGLLRSRGFSVTYVAPPSAGTYHLVVRAPRPGGGQERSVLAVEVRPDLVVEPGQVVLAPGATRAFTARVKGLPRAEVGWSVEPAGCGSITPTGVLTAPGDPCTLRVVATLAQDPTLTASATVRVE